MGDALGSIIAIILIPPLNHIRIAYPGVQANDAIDDMPFMFPSIGSRDRWVISNADISMPAPASR